MQISGSIQEAAVTIPGLSQKLSAIESVLNSPENSVAVVLGMKDAVREILHIDTLYVPAPISFMARKTNRGIEVEPL